MTAASLQPHHHHRPLKLFNRGDNNGTSQTYYSRQQTIAKRKSAVELLQETKPLYVKSETVLDRKQELRRSHYYSYWEDGALIHHSNFGSTVFPNSGVRSLTSSSPSTCDDNHYHHHHLHIDQSHLHPCASSKYSLSTLPLPKSPRLIPPPPAFRKSTGSFQLQNKLRKLLNVSKEDLLDSKENSTDGKCIIRSKDNTRTQFCTIGKRQICSPIRSNRGQNQQVFTCHKSLPDLSNADSVSTDGDTDNVDKSPFSTNSTSSSRICKQFQSTDSVSISSCRNDRLFINSVSEIPCEQENELYSTELTSNRVYPDSLLVSSSVELYSDVISPPSLYSDFKIQDLSLIANNQKTRPISRSKSDVGTRASSSLKTVEIPLQNPTVLNNFFDNLGMNFEEYNFLITPRSNASSPVYFNSSDSSVDSHGDYISGGENNSINYNVELPSIVERNARIIKWLCNCKKAMEHSYMPPDR